MQTISRLRTGNFLSLRQVDIDLQGLNVLVGPNGAGKSNILQVFEFLGLVARHDLVPAIDKMGGFENLRFRGHTAKNRNVMIELEGNITKHASARAPDRYMLSFGVSPIRLRRLSAKSESQEFDTRLIINRDEEIALKRTAGRGRRITLRGSEMNFGWVGSSPRRAPERISLQKASTGLATLRRLGNEYDADQVEALAQVFEKLRLFEIEVDKVRKPAPADEKPILEQNGSNIAAYLIWLQREHNDSFRLLCDDVSFVLPSFENFEFEHIGGAEAAISVLIKERHLAAATPLARASFGTIRAICLFAMLHDPNPPRLTCLEELDHGLHPHALDRIVERLRDASERTQIIAATHSPALVNRLATEELIIVERVTETGESRVFRPATDVIEALSADGDYGLGEIWFSGAIGGVL